MNYIKQLEAITDEEIREAGANCQQSALVDTLLNMRDRCWQLSGQIGAEGDAIDFTLKEWTYPRRKNAKNQK